MGYYSDAALVVSALGYESIPDATKERMKDGFVAERDGHRLYHWESVKWYDCSDEYVAHHVMEWMFGADADEYLFHRIGEDSNDNEIMGNLEDYIFNTCISRAIHITIPE